MIEVAPNRVIVHIFNKFEHILRKLKLYFGDVTFNHILTFQNLQCKVLVASGPNYVGYFFKLSVQFLTEKDMFANLMFAVK